MSAGPGLHPGGYYPESMMSAIAADRERRETEDFQRDQAAGSIRLEGEKALAHARRVGAYVVVEIDGYPSRSTPEKAEANTPHIPGDVKVKLTVNARTGAPLSYVSAEAMEADEARCQEWAYYYDAGVEIVRQA